jgi:AcrR family transcriptional regulator
MTTAGNTVKPVPARSRILDTALRLFYARGPRGVGVDTVIAESGVAKATFYKYFPRKDDLVLAYLDEVDQLWFGQLRAAARAAGGDPREQLVGMFDALATACRRQGYHGCAFINTAAEVDADTDVHAHTVEHKTVVRAWVADLPARWRPSWCWPSPRARISTRPPPPTWIAAMWSPAGQIPRSTMRPCS